MTGFILVGQVYSYKLLRIAYEQETIILQIMKQCIV